ncbi:MalY/PatB family protein [Streptomyces sp. RKND-216]|uniref:MalY/PatB family protein n=1 Tax=Streptomyces sp. RKND-216 TaxID=2562581 RepID=UPI0014463031|nr:MalY/PatB family protein [Streptomyces sp. RKND-216]
MTDTEAIRTDPLVQCSLTELRRRTSTKWRTHPADVLPLWVAEMDVPLAEPIAQALREAVDLGDTGYAEGPGPYAAALDGFAAKRWGWRVPADRIRLVPDVMQGAAELLRLVTRPGDAVVLSPPVYTPFFQTVARLGRRLVEAPLGADGRLDLDVLDAAFRTAVTGGGRAAYLLSSPHNPTGTVHTADELAAVARLAETHGVRVIADEIHAPLVPAGATFTPYLTVPGAERGYALFSASKAWNLAGLKAAVAVAGEAAADDLARMPAEVQNGASHFGVLAHVAALRDGGAWLDSLLDGLAANRTLLADLLAERLPDVRWREPEGTFLAWLDCAALGLGDDPAAAFLGRGRVAVVPGHVFGSSGAGHVRLNFGTTPEILSEAVTRLAATRS